MNDGTGKSDIPPLPLHLELNDDLIGFSSSAHPRALKSAALAAAQYCVLPIAITLYGNISLPAVHSSRLCSITDAPDHTMPFEGWSTLFILSLRDQTDVGANAVSSADVASHCRARWHLLLVKQMFPKIMD